MTTTTNDTTKTKPKAVDAKALAEASRQKLAEAKMKVLDREELATRAEESADELETALSSGDDKVTAMQLVTARAEVERSSLLLSAARSAAKRAERNLTNDDDRLADLISGPLSILTGVQCLFGPMVTLPKAEDTDVKAGPVLYVSQSEPATEKGGMLSGEVTIAYRRGRLYAPLSLAGATKAFDRMGWAVQVNRDTNGSIDVQEQTAVRSHKVAEGVFEDVATFRVHQAFDIAPERTSAPAVEQFASWFREQVARATFMSKVEYENTYGDRHDALTPEQMRTALNNRATIVSTKLSEPTTRDGLTEATISVRLKVNPGGFGRARVLDNVQRTHVGKVVPSAGYVVSIDAAGYESTSNSPTSNQYEATYSVVVRYRLADTDN